MFTPIDDRRSGDVLATLRRLPELCGHLAALTLPTQQAADGAPASRDLQRAPLRIGPLDELEAVFRELWLSADYWAERLGITGLVSSEHMIRRAPNGEVLGISIVATEAHGIDTATVWATTLVNRIESWWPRVVVHSSFESWAGAVVDETFVPAVRRWPLWARRPIPQHARECPTCGAEDVFADPLIAGQALCYSCERAFVLDDWRKVKAAADTIGRDPRTIKRWIDAGDLAVRIMAGARHVEMHEVRAVARTMDDRNPAVA